MKKTEKVTINGNEAKLIVSCICALSDADLCSPPHVSDKQLETFIQILKDAQFDAEKIVDQAIKRYLIIRVGSRLYQYVEEKRKRQIEQKNK